MKKLNLVKLARNIVHTIIFSVIVGFSVHSTDAHAWNFYRYMANCSGCNSAVPGDNGEFLVYQNNTLIWRSKTNDGRAIIGIDNSGDTLYEMYHEGPAGTEYWGYVTEYVDASDAGSSATFRRNMPYASSIRFRSSNGSYTVTPEFDLTGSTSALVSVTSPTNYPYSTNTIYARLQVRNASGSIIYDTEKSRNGSGDISFSNIPLDTKGIYERRVFVRTTYGSWSGASKILTDYWAWEAGPSVNIPGEMALNYVCLSGFDCNASTPLVGAGDHRIIAYLENISDTDVDGTIRYEYRNSSNSVKTLCEEESFAVAANKTASYSSSSCSFPVGSDNYRDYILYATLTYNGIGSPVAISSNIRVIKQESSVEFNVQNVLGGNQNLLGQWEVHLYDDNNNLVTTTPPSSSPDITINNLASGNYRYFVFFKANDGLSIWELWRDSTVGLEAGQSKAVQAIRQFPWIKSIQKSKSTYAQGENVLLDITLRNDISSLPVSLNIQTEDGRLTTRSLTLSSTSDTLVSVDIGTFQSDSLQKMKVWVAYQRNFQPEKGMWTTDHWWPLEIRVENIIDGELQNLSSASGETKSGESLEFSFDVQNIGNVAGKYKLRASLISEDNQFIKSVQLADSGLLTPGATESISGSIEVPFGFPTGSYRLRVSLEDNSSNTLDQVSNEINISEIWEMEVRLVEGGALYRIPIGYGHKNEYGELVWGEVPIEEFYVYEDELRNLVSPNQAAQLYAMSLTLNWLMPLPYTDLNDLMSALSYEADQRLGQLSDDQFTQARRAAGYSVISGATVALTAGATVCGVGALFTAGGSCLAGTALGAGLLTLSIFDAAATAVDQIEISLSEIEESTVILIYAREEMNIGFRHFLDVERNINSYRYNEIPVLSSVADLYRKGLQGMSRYSSAAAEFSKVGITDINVLDRYFMAIWAGAAPGGSTGMLIYNHVIGGYSSQEVAALITEEVIAESLREKEEDIFFAAMQTSYAEFFSAAWGGGLEEEVPIAASVAAGLHNSGVLGTFRLVADVTGLTIGEIESFYFDFGDGTALLNQRSGAYVASTVAYKTYEAPGTYEVKMIVTAFDGRSSQASVIIDVVEVETNPIVRSIKIDGPSFIQESSQGVLTAFAIYSDGSTQPITPTWHLDSDYASISDVGAVAAIEISGNKSLDIRAEYLYGGVKYTASYTLYINDSDLEIIPLYPDSDADGIRDIDDNCPEIYNPEQKNSDGDAKGDDCDPDDDNDGIVDTWEIENGTNPLVDDANLDSDNDGLTNYQESKVGGNPHEPDPDLWVDMTGCFLIETSPGVFDRINRAISSILSITSNCEDTLIGPIEVVLDDSTIPFTGASYGENESGQHYWLLNSPSGEVSNGQVFDPISLQFALARVPLSYSIKVYGVKLPSVEPKLVFLRSENRAPVLPNPAYTIYFLSIDNFDEFPAEIFEPAPDLPACGLNNNSSRSWVSIFDSQGNYIYGFCGLSQPSDLQDLWFGVPEGEAPPSAVYVEISDRELGKLYRSNEVLIQPGGDNGVTDPTETVLFEDNFDVETVGTIPSQWVNGPWADASTNYVTDALSFSASNSIHVESLAYGQKGIYAPDTVVEEDVTVSTKFYLPAGGEVGYNFGSLAYAEVSVRFRYLGNNLATIIDQSSDGQWSWSGTLSTEEWHDLVVKFDYDGGQYEILVDGQSLGIHTYIPVSSGGWASDLSLLGANQLGVRTVNFDDIQILSGEVILGNTLQDGLVAYYPFDGNSNDASGLDNHATEHGGPSYTAGLVGDSLSLDGVDDYVTLPRSPSLTFNAQSFTIATWFNFRGEMTSDNPAGGIAAPIFSTYENDNGSAHFVALNMAHESIGYSGVNSLGAFLRDHPYTHNTGLEGDYFYPDADINTWYHVALAFDKPSGVASFYVDGRLVHSWSPPTTIANFDNGTDPRVGSNVSYYLDSNLNKIPNENFARMEVDELSIYDRALAAAEIGALYGSNFWTYSAGEGVQSYLSLSFDDISAEAGSTITEGPGGLGIQINTPSQNCDSATLVSNKVLPNEPWEVVYDFDKKGKGYSDLQIRANNENYIRLFVSTDDTDGLKIRTSLDGNVTDQYIAGASAYLNVNNTFKISWDGSEYRFYVNGSEVGTPLVTNHFVSLDTRAKVVTGTCAWKSGGAHDVIHRVEVNIGGAETSDVVFISDRSGSNQIWSTSLSDSSKLKQLTNLPAAYKPAVPTWSPDGNWIAFQALAEGVDHSQEIFAVKSDGSEAPIQLTNYLTSSVWGYQPDFADDSQWIYYLEGHIGYSDVMRVNLYTKEIQIVHADSGLNTHWFDISRDGQYRAEGSESGCCWSPNTYTTVFDTVNGTSDTIIPTDGNFEENGRFNVAADKITYQEFVGYQAPSNIWIVDATGSNNTQITFDSGDVRNTEPVWLENDRDILYTSNLNGDLDLMIVNTQTGQITPFLSGAANDSSADIYIDSP